MICPHNNFSYLLSVSEPPIIKSGFPVITALNALSLNPKLYMLLYNFCACQ